MFSIIYIFSCSSIKENINHKFEIIELKKYYAGKGSIVPLTCTWAIPIHFNYKRINLTIDKINQSENVLERDIENYLNRLFFHSELYTAMDFEGQALLQSIYNKYLTNTKRILKKYYRQYSGFVNENNEVFVEIKLFNYDSGLYNNWADNVVINYDEHYYEEKNICHYYINLTKGEIENLKYCKNCKKNDKDTIETRKIGF